MEQIAIKINGEALKDSILKSVEVAQELNQHWWCRVECRQTGDNRPPLEDWLGQQLQVVVSEADGSHTIFDGFVLEGDLRYEVYGSYAASLVGVTPSYKLDLTSEEKYFRKKSLSAIANELAGEDGLSARVKCKDEATRNYVQWGESDFSFLLRLADDHSCWIRPTKDGIEILDEFQSGSTVQWRGERGLLDFRVRGRLSQPSFKGTHYNARQMSSRSFVDIKKDAEFFGASARMVSAVQTASQRMPSGALFIDSRAATEDEYQRLLQKESVRSIGGKIVAFGTSQNAALKPGDTLSVEGVLDANGTYGLTKVIHTWRSQGYRNEFLCTPWKQWTNPVAPQPVEMRGVVTARVVDHNDPRGMGRVQIKYDWQEDGQTGWARMISPHAGADRGFMFMPEKGDEVLVTFEHGDPERPVIIGGLWNGVNAAPRMDFYGDNIAANDIKRVVTKSGNRMQFVDAKGKEAVVLATPNSNSFTMTENSADTGGRNLIVLQTEGDIILSAAGRIHLKAALFSHEIGGTK